MRKITKGINGFVIPALVVIITLLLLPLGMSFWVKNNYSKLLSYLGQMHNINLKLVKFERGWFASDSLIQVTLPTVNKNDSPLQFVLKQRILNGPYLVGKIGDKKRIYFANGLIYTAAKAPNNHQLTSDATAKSPTISEQQNNLITFNNLILNNELQQKNSLWYGQYSLEADKLIYFNPQQPIQIERMALKTQQTKTTNGTSDLAIIAHAYKAKSNLFNIKPVKLNYCSPK